MHRLFSLFSLALVCAVMLAAALAVMFGLTFATFLTLLVVPTLVATCYGMPSPQRGAAPTARAS